MLSREAHLGKRLCVFYYTVQDVASVSLEGGADGTDIFAEWFTASQLGA